MMVLLVVVPVAALGLCGIVAVLGASGGSSASGAPRSTGQPTDSETVNPLSKDRQFEIGEGSNRSIMATAWPADGSAMIELPAGTLIDLLVERATHKRPASYPSNVAASRVRVASGPYAGTVAYVKLSQVQATSAAH